MNFKANYVAVNLTSAAPYTYVESANTGTTIHQIYCLTPGSVTITAVGGGTFTWAATANASIDVMVGSATVSSGTFVGFKSKFFSNQNVSTFGPY